MVCRITRRLWTILALFLVAGLPPAAAVWADEADDQFAVAAGHYEREQWDLAVEQFETFLRQYPDHPKATQGTFFLAEAQLQLGDFAEAEPHFRAYLQREPGGSYARAALFRAGEAAYLTDRHDRAKADLQRFLSGYPDDSLCAYVLPYLGDIALGQGDAETAERRFRAALTRYPQGRLQDDCRFGLAQALEKQRQGEEAEQLYRAVAAKADGPLADDAQFRLGALQYATGKHAAAVETFSAFETRLAESPWRSNARLGRGWALMKLDRLREAEPVFESIASDPKVGVEARYWLGLARKAQQQWKAAAETLSAAAAAAAAADHELTPAIRFHAGDAMLRAGELAAAREQFDHVIAAEAGEGTEDDSWLDDAMRGEIQAALQAGDHTAVERQAAAFARRVPESPLKVDVRRMHVRSLLEQKQYRRAVDLIEPLLAEGAAGRLDLEFRYLLAVGYQGLAEHEEALAALLPVVDSAEGQLKSDAQLAQGSLLMAIGRYAEAVGPLEAFLAGQPTGGRQLEGRGELAVCCARSGRLDRAKEAYAELLAAQPEHGLLLPVTEQLAEAAYEAGDTAWSAELSGRLATAGGSQEQTLKGMAGLGWSQWKEGQGAEAAATFEKLLDADPDADVAAEAAMARGRILEQLDKPDSALGMYGLVIEKYPDSSEHPQALLAAARLRDSLQQHRQSAALYQRLAEQYPRMAESDAVLYEWAWVLDGLGQAAECDAVFERLHKQHPSSPYWADATYRLARRAFAAGDYAKADQFCSDVLAGNSGAEMREHALYLRGQIAAAREDWNRVAEAFAALVERFPESPSRMVAEYWVAEAAYRRRDYETAGRLLEALARRTEGDDEAWLAMIPLRRAQVLAQQGQWNEAYEIAAKIEAEYPNFEQQYEAAYLIGRSLANRAEFQGAREAYLKVIRSATGAKTETAAMAQWMIGETYFHQRNYEAALREYLKVEILYAYPTWQAAALLQAGKCRDLLGESKEADKLYTRLMREHAGTRFAEEAARRMVLSTPERQGAARRD